MATGPPVLVRARFLAGHSPPEHAPINPLDTSQTGITPQMVATVPPADEVLAKLDTLPQVRKTGGYQAKATRPRQEALFD
jgi:hypothetical protein